MNNIREFLREGQVIPALPLALDENRKLSEKHQRALARYYVAAGTGGLAVGVHSTQFEIREPQFNLYEPVLRIASETLDESLAANPRPYLKIAGVCGKTEQALAEVTLAKSLGYHAVLLSITAMKDEEDAATIEHCRKVSEILPIIGFYLQPAVGGKVYSYEFWQEFVKIPNLVAFKLAPFNRYFTQDVIRALAASGRDDVVLYTGNDDHIVLDLLTPHVFPGPDGQPRTLWIEGGLLGQWGVWTQKAVELLEEIKRARKQSSLDRTWLTRAVEVTDINAVVFDVANNFHGCIPGIHEMLRRQGLLPGTWCLNPKETLSPGQSEEIDRIWNTYPEYCDDEFVKAHLHEWLK